MKKVRHSYGFSELIAAAHTAARMRFADLPPTIRSALVKQSDVQSSHFYSWLRGTDSSLSIDRIDGILKKAGWGFFVNYGKISCGNLRISNRREHLWRYVDWRKTTGQIANELDVHVVVVSMARRKYAKHTLRGY